MILNAYAVLNAFLALLRLLFGVLVVGIGTKAWLQGRKSITPERRKALEDRGSLLFLMAFLLLGLNLVSWPLLYLLLQSYVPEWPGVMCIYGVTQIGVAAEIEATTTTPGSGRGRGLSRCPGGGQRQRYRAGEHQETRRPLQCVPRSL